MTEIHRKIMLIGDEMVGKTSLIRRFVDDKFEAEYIRTLGFELSEKAVTVNNTHITFTIWDIGRRTGKTNTLLKNYFDGARGMFCVFDHTRVDTWEHVEHWLDYVRKEVPEIVVILVGNKADLEIKGPSKKTIEEFCATHDIPVYFDTSAKTGENVQEMFEDMAERLHEIQVKA